MASSQFNPEDFLIKLPLRRRNPRSNQWETQYADYLEIKWRMVWFREQNKENTKTLVLDKIIDKDNRFAYFELQLSDTKGNTEVGVGSETGEDFRDYIEKAYTKAYGRALAALGYGTQFAPELDEDDRIADSPTIKPDSSVNRSQKADGLVTEQQRRTLFNIYNSLNLDEEKMRELIQDRYRKTDSKALTSKEASDLIHHLQEFKQSE